ncbi:hypothetical protein ABFB94_10930 [Escherichia coli]|uniref:hypothetical protein n=1 Tax=Escherichia coli TaxID=562 RepID=UPI00320F9A09
MTVRVRVPLPARVALVVVQGTRLVVAVLHALQTARQGVPVVVQDVRGVVRVGALMRVRALVRVAVQRRVPVAVRVAARRVQDDRR